MSKSDSYKKSRSKSVEMQNWFVGLITKPTVERYLKKEGQYLVRTQEKNGRLEFVLSVRGKNECAHLTITYEEGVGWAINAKLRKAFHTIVELIKYYEKNKVPVGNSGYLRIPFEKPKWFIRHENITYDVENDLIGTGNFCDVFKGKLFGKILVALKICHGPTGENSSPEEKKKIDEAKESLEREACLMSDFKHPNIVKFHGICCDVPPVCIVLERCTGGSLDAHLLQFADKISNGERVLYSFGASKGMCYLQEKHLIHRDLAARNCLISKYGIIKIGDFGLSQLVSDLTGKCSKERLPVRWMAPETIRKDPKYSTKSDVWSFGVLLYEIFNDGIKPWPDWDVRQCATCIKQGNMPDMPDKTPSEIVKLVSECWTVDVEKRCDFIYIANKLSSIHLLYAPPKLNDLTIAKLKDVKPLTEKDAELKEERSDCEKESLSKKSSESLASEKSMTELVPKYFKKRRRYKKQQESHESTETSRTTTQDHTSRSQDCSKEVDRNY
ncbi:unnamed protein product [Thelazia callipaeda]|uniref:Tyrosine-protein kinase n=1 Tax=Thelazia callipaeda TaxID=103827 RepID=A0A158RAY0_THECL|nr:unnamed protein product [Thelazia callipaeda]